MKPMPGDKNIQRIAKRLAGDFASQDLAVGESGFRVPTWVFYISEATRLWEQHCAANDLKECR